MVDEAQASEDSEAEPRLDLFGGHAIWGWLIVAALLAAGGGLIYWGTRFSAKESYDQSILASFGTAFALAGPLFLVEELLRRTLRETKQLATDAKSSVSAVQRDLQDLSGVYQALSRRMDDSRLQLDDERGEAAGGNRSAMVDLYRQALAAGTIHRRGLRVSTGWQDLALHISGNVSSDSEDDLIPTLIFETDTLEAVGEPVPWPDAVKAIDVLGELWTTLRQTGKHPPDAVFKRTNLFGRLADDLKKAIDLHSGADGAVKVDDVVQFLDEIWAVTRGGLTCLTNVNVSFTASEVAFANTESIKTLQDRVFSAGLDPTEFGTVLALATAIHQGLRSEASKPFRELNF